MIHERLEIDYFIQQYPLDQYRDELVDCTAVCGPFAIAMIEQIRSEVRRQGHDLGKPVPLDLCVWKLGDSPRLETTKIGGIPYWPKHKNWPLNEDDEPLQFIAQFCFADSTDLVSNLPGDILTMLAPYPAFGQHELVWHRFDEGETVEEEEFPSSIHCLTPFHAVLHRTADYPEAHYSLFEDFGDPYSFWSRFLHPCTKIGGLDVEAFNAGSSDISSRPGRSAPKKAKIQYLGELGTIGASSIQPFVNIDRYDYKEMQKQFGEQLEIGDCGGYNFYLQGLRTEAHPYSA